MLDHWENVVTRFIGNNVKLRKKVTTSLRSYLGDSRKNRHNAIRKTVHGEDAAERKVFNDKLKYQQDQQASNLCGTRNIKLK